MKNFKKFGINNIVNGKGVINMAGDYDDIISENIESIDHELKKLNNNFFQLNKTLNGFLNLALLESSLKNKTPDQVAKVRNALESIKNILKEN